tara:strand:+ start:339 stop:554 length:216 start_codon:yes stop_codon:yes gene_type:complete
LRKLLRRVDDKLIVLENTDEHTFAEKLFLIKAEDVKSILFKRAFLFLLMIFRISGLNSPSKSRSSDLSLIT